MIALRTSDTHVQRRQWRRGRENASTKNNIVNKSWDVYDNKNNEVRKMKRPQTKIINKGHIKVRTVREMIEAP